jgi:hypothetical protein
MAKYARRITDSPSQTEGRHELSFATAPRHEFSAKPQQLECSRVAHDVVDSGYDSDEETAAILTDVLAGDLAADE